MRTHKLVADKYDIKKHFKNGGDYGTLYSPRVYKIENKFYIKAETWHEGVDVGLIDYETSDFHLFDSEEEAIKAWTGKKPTGTNWSH